MGGGGDRRHTEKLRTGRHNSWRNRASVNGSAGKAGSCSRMHAAPPRAPTFRRVCGTAPGVTRPSPTLPLDPRSSAQLYLGMCCSLATYKSAKKTPKLQEPSPIQPPLINSLKGETTMTQVETESWKSHTDRCYPRGTGGKQHQRMYKA